MKLRFKKPFRYEFQPGYVKVILPGVHDLPEDVARMALKFHAAERVFEKVAPENKVAAVPETKADSKPVRRRRARAKPDA